MILIRYNCSFNYTISLFEYKK